jgi:SnoaL-like domain
MPEAGELLYMNLHEAFFERDPEKRWAAIERTYAEDVRFIDPEGEVAGWQALNDRAQKILDDAPADFVLEEDGLGYVSPDIAVQPWRFGPAGNPIVRGIDILTVRGGSVSVVRTLIGFRRDS